MNLEKHQVSFAYAARIFDRAVLEWIDGRRSYGEARFIAIGQVASDTLVVIYTWRGVLRRLISARKANRKERDAYQTEVIGSGRPEGQ